MYKKYNCTVLLKCLTNGFISLVFLSKNKIPLDRKNCKRNNEGVNPLVYVDLILDGQMSAAKCSQHTIVSNGIKSLESGTAS